MRRSLRYMDAVKVLAGGENQLVKLLDDASATMLLGSGVFDLFEAREQALRLLEEVLDKFGERLRGIDRLSRTERIHAAHHIIQITAYFDAFTEAMAEFRPEVKVRFSGSEQVSLTGGADSGPGWADLFQTLSNRRPLLMPLAEDTATKVFKGMSWNLRMNLPAFALWQALDETQQDLLLLRLSADVPHNAATRYQEYLRRLSVDCPEFGVWINLQAHATTREQLAAGLADLEKLLAPLSTGSAEHQQASLTRAYRAGLTKPIIITSGPDSHLSLPSLGEGYVDHDFRLAFGHLPTGKSWEGDSYPVRHDLPAVLTRYLMSQDALDSPLLILGQPGSGKSVLTRVLAARLPADRFLPIRVELRRVNAAGEVQDYIESAIREQTGENVQWSRFATANPDLTPVVILDGFDELLQATGVAQTDFLLRVERFQERELDQGRPVAVIVTSRTAVAGRATLPTGSPIIRLEPFGDEQIAAWIDIWNRSNSSTLVDRGVKPLSTDTVLRYRTLAEQPLLLLMLALYDATDNALSAVDPGLNQSAVYEQLLRDFARRELMKDPDITDLEQRIDEELLRLSVVAFAMFNRGAQWIDADSLTEDLRALGIWEAVRDQSTLRSTLTAGQQMIGRFFFIHDARATRDGDDLQTYEFLHATFSEYLIARLVVRLLGELAELHLVKTRSVSRTIDDAMLYALLSFDCLAARAPIVQFTGELIAKEQPATRDAMTEIVQKLFHSSLMQRTDHTFADYEPVVSEVVARASRWNANLFLLMALTQTSGISMRELYPEKGHGAVYEWHRLSNLWRSCVRGEGWNGLADCLSIERAWVGEYRDIVIRVGPPSPPASQPDMRWTYNIPDAPWHDGERWDSHSQDEMIRRSNFLVDRRMDLAMQTILPVADALPTMGNSLFHTRDGRLVTAMTLLSAALIAPYSGESADAAILDLVRALTVLPNPHTREAQLYARLAAGLITLAVELETLSVDARIQATAALLDASSTALGDPQLEVLVARILALRHRVPRLPQPRPGSSPDL